MAYRLFTRILCCGLVLLLVFVSCADNRPSSVMETIEAEKKAEELGTRLLAALFVWDLKAAEIYFDRGASVRVEITNETALTALGRFARWPGVEVFARRIIERGATVNAQQKSGWDCLMRASMRNGKKLVLVLLEHGADPNLTNNTGWTALEIARYYGNEPIAQILLEHGAKDSKKNIALDKELITAVCGKFDGPGFPPYPGVPEDTTEKSPAELLLAGASANASDPDGNTALMYAVMFGKTETIELLIKNGANVNVLNRYESTPLIKAAIKNDVASAKLLLDSGADIELGQKNGTPLMWAALNRRNEMIKFLVANNASVNARDSYGNTPLTNAARAGDLETIQLLLAHGADCHLTTLNGKTAARVAEDSNHKEVAAYLRSVCKK